MRTERDKTRDTRQDKRYKTGDGYLEVEHPSSKQAKSASPYSHDYELHIAYTIHYRYKT